MAIILKDSEERLIVSVYDLSLNVHNSLLASRYILNREGQHITQSELDNSSYL